MANDLSDLIKQRLSPTELAQYALVEQREAVRAYCLHLRGVYPDETPSRRTTFHLLWRHDFKFAELHETALPARLSLRHDAKTVAAWREHYPVIQLHPYWFVREEETWTHITLDGQIPADVLLDMIDTAYQYQFRQLPPELQQFITEFLNGQPPDDAMIRRLIAHEGLAHRTDEIIALLQPAIRIRATAVSAHGMRDRACSKFGGYADFPRDLPYPVHDNRAMVFLAQINLSELPASHPTRAMLPATGMLYFFGHMAEPDNGYVEHGKVIYYDGDLPRLTGGMPPRELWNGWFSFQQEATLDFLDELTLPDAGDYASDPAADVLQGSADELEKYQEMHGKLRLIYDALYGHIAAHQMFGYPRLIQSPVREVDEVLLLQIDSDYFKVGFEWGDGGSVYFTLPQAQLAAGQFEPVHVSWDCS